eukprot:CAMPEP_0184972590 /NCGR_PEP_ID=MMETSP1098-20130426/4557_1 /TAXON_ID=89044 /ORGANISM="Spumella elongata, Strain CCAP 955/1" /LENGTH=70 /DNA_ID=CAMNT_0027494909 /DNA_START=41 /DNA_END=250 /DNA_ORIENTATION=+
MTLKITSGDMADWPLIDTEFSTLPEPKCATQCGSSSGEKLPIDERQTSLLRTLEEKSGEKTQIMASPANL